MNVRTRLIPRLPGAAGERPRRLVKRYPAKSLLVQLLVADPTLAAARPLDLSVQGAGLILPRWFAPGAVLGLRLYNRRLLFCWTGELRLSHSRPMCAGLCRAGGPFLEPIPPSALRRLLN